MSKYYFLSYIEKIDIGGNITKLEPNMVLKDIHPVVWISTKQDGDNGPYMSVIRYLLFYNEIPEDVAVKAEKLKYIDCWGF